MFGVSELFHTSLRTLYCKFNLWDWGRVKTNRNSDNLDFETFLDLSPFQHFSTTSFSVLSLHIHLKGLVVERMPYLGAPPRAKELIPQLLVSTAVSGVLLQALRSPQAMSLGAALQLKPQSSTQFSELSRFPTQCPFTEGEVETPGDKTPAVPWQAPTNKDTPVLSQSDLQPFTWKAVQQRRSDTEFPAVSDTDDSSELTRMTWQLNSVTTSKESMKSQSRCSSEWPPGSCTHLGRFLHPQTCNSNGYMW